jgi:hypothetical protein
VFLPHFCRLRAAGRQTLDHAKERRIVRIRYGQLMEELESVLGFALHCGKRIEISFAPGNGRGGRPRLEDGKGITLPSSHYDRAERPQQGGVTAGCGLRSHADRGAEILVGSFQSRGCVYGVAVRGVIELARIPTSPTIAGPVSMPMRVRPNPIAAGASRRR